jgi:hypothetical protein
LNILDYRNERGHAPYLLAIGENAEFRRLDEAGQSLARVSLGHFGQSTRVLLAIAVLRLANTIYSAWRY